MPDWIGNSNSTANVNVNWTVPFACTSINVTVIGGGGSGFADNDGDSLGGGGSGGGLVQGRYPTVPGSTIQIQAGRGGRYINDSRESGSASYVRSFFTGLEFDATAGGGAAGDAGGGGSATSSGQLALFTLAPGGNGGSRDTNYQGGQGGPCGASFAVRGGQGGAAGGGSGCGYVLACCISNGAGGVTAAYPGRGGRGRLLNGSLTGCPSSFNPDQGYGGGGGGNGGNPWCGSGQYTGWGAGGAVRITEIYAAPVINSFSITEQTSSTGIPSSNVTATWTTQYATNVSINQGVGAVSPAGGGSLTINTGLQSVAPGTSPATRTYTLTASGPGGTVTATATARVFNDNQPSTVTAATLVNPGSRNRTNNLEEITVYTATVTTTGTDMPLNVTGGSGVQVSANSGGGFTTGTVLVPVGNPFYVRFTSLPYNTSTVSSGVNSFGEAIGQPNTKTVEFDITGTTYSFNVTTRPPVIEESFDAEGQPLSPEAFPDPEISLPIGNFIVEEFVNTNSVNTNDIEIPVEIKTSDGDAQVQINNDGNWLDMREI